MVLTASYTDNLYSNLSGSVIYRALVKVLWLDALSTKYGATTFKNVVKLNITVALFEINKKHLID